MELKRYKAILLDGDGVLWKSNQPLPGIKDLFDLLSNHDVRWALLTNNNSHTANSYIDKLNGFGIPASESSVFTSSTVTADYLLEKYGRGMHLHVVGSKALIETLEGVGFKISHGEQQPKSPVAAVVAGMDREISHEKIKIAMRLILNGVDFVATNTDGSYPTPEGINPGTGMVIGALQFASGVEPYIAGKPYPAIFNTALKTFGIKADQSLMVGDRLNTDILGANQLGIDSAAVLTGVDSLEDIQRSNIKPDFIFDDIIALRLALKEVYKP